MSKTLVIAGNLDGRLNVATVSTHSSYVPNELQVKPSSSSIASELYMSTGISHATQHIACIKDAGSIVPINKEREGSDHRARVFRADAKPKYGQPKP